MDYCPQGRKELAMTEHTHTHTHTQVMRLKPSQVRLAPHQRLQRAPVPPRHVDSHRTPPKNRQEGAHQTRLDRGLPEP